MTTALNAECRRALRSVSAYLDGDLDEQACELVERHCRQCARCAEVIDGLRETVGLCRKAGATPVPETVRQRARERVRRLLDGERDAQTAPLEAPQPD